MKNYNLILALICMLFTDMSFADVTFFNHSKAHDVEVAYQLCKDGDLPGKLPCSGSTVLTLKKRVVDDTNSFVTINTAPASVDTVICDRKL